jgi:hypothetical protein
VFRGICNIGQKVLSIPNVIREGISKGYNFLSNIPVIGDITKNLANTPVFRGMSAAQLANIASQGLDIANK